MTTAAITNVTSSLVNNQSSSSVVANPSQNQNSIPSQNNNNSKSTNPTSKTSPPKLSPLSPVGTSLSPPTYPAVLGRGATLPQKSKVPPPVPPRGSPRPKRDLPPNRGKFYFAHGSLASFTEFTENWVWKTIKKENQISVLFIILSLKVIMKYSAFKMLDSHSFYLLFFNVATNAFSFFFFLINFCL